MATRERTDRLEKEWKGKEQRQRRSVIFLSRAREAFSPYAKFFSRNSTGVCHWCDQGPISENRYATVWLTWRGFICLVLSSVRSCPLNERKKGRKRERGRAIKTWDGYSFTHPTEYKTRIWCFLSDQTMNGYSMKIDPGPGYNEALNIISRMSVDELTKIISSEHELTQVVSNLSEVCLVFFDRVALWRKFRLGQTLRNSETKSRREYQTFGWAQYGQETGFWPRETEAFRTPSRTWPTESSTAGSSRKSR